MRKKVILILITLAFVAAIILVYLNTRTLSPEGSARLTSGEVGVRVTYSRPSVRDRIIFGTEEEGALQPYGVYWRLGANMATEITFSKDVLFNGQPVQVGSYRMYAIPGRDSFELFLNSELGKSGSEEPNHDLDVLRTTATVERIPSVEQFTISLEPISNGMNIIFEWSDVRFVVPVVSQ